MSTNEIKLTPRTFEGKILYFNGMYKLPIAPIPSLSYEAQWQKAKFPAQVITDSSAVRKRLDDFFGKILVNELSEYTAIKAKSGLGEDEIDILVDLADLLGDIIVYCASEMARYGIPLQETLNIIMDSNFSKLDANGEPIYDENGKVSKGPFYWKPEPKIKQMLLDMQQTGAMIKEEKDD